MNKINKKIFIGFGCCILFSIFLLWYSKRKIIESTTPIQEISWLNYTETNELIPQNRSIFFLETSHMNKNEIALTGRQCCAIESAALMNPTMKIHLFIFTQAINYVENTRNYVAHLSSYKNIIIEHVNIEEYIKNTLLEEWWSRINVLKTSLWPAVHASDILRLLTIWKFGGIYFDLDVVVKSSFEQIANFAGAENPEMVANGIFGAEQTGIGKRFIDACLQELMKDFRGDSWAHNGPRVITTTLQKICHTQETGSMTAHHCDGFTVFPTAAFYPIGWPSWRQYFDSNNKDNTMKIIEKSLLIHVWNKMSSSEVIKVGSEVPYALVANQYCPKIYSNCGESF